jgi:putative copper export protein/methionine-rich copper-binding protein CopC
MLVKTARIISRALGPLILAVLAIAWTRAGEVGSVDLHDRLVRSEPAADDTVDVVPSVLRLTYSREVTLEAAQVRLTGPSGEVELRPLALEADSPAILLAGVQGRWEAGAHTVAWQILGADGHAVNGEFTFEVAADAAGLAPPIETPPPSVAPAEAPVTEALPTFGPESPLYVAVRWLWFSSLIGVLGAITFRIAVLGRLTTSEASVTQVLPAAASLSARIGAVSALLALVAALLRLVAQQAAVGIDMGILINATTWGRGWLLHAGAAAVAFVGFVMARRDGRQGWLLAIPAAFALSLAPALSGHAIAAEPVALNVMADTVHVIGAGGWLGTLLLVLFAGIPSAQRAGADRDHIIAVLVRAFSPLALVFAAIVAATGVFRAWQQIGTFGDLFSSGYGQALLLKLGALAVVLALGAYNFLRIRPSLPDRAASHRLRRSAGLELAMGALVVLLTAVLVATPPPADEEVPVAVMEDGG